MDAPDPAPDTRADARAAAADESDDALRRLADEVADAVVERTLAKARWTHDAHLLACVSLVSRQGPLGALRTLRRAIPAYNEATGVANTATSGYHDTITVYFVWAIDRLLGAGASRTTLLADAALERSAPLGWWDPATLWSPAARLGWLEPTLPGDGGPAPREFNP